MRLADRVGLACRAIKEAGLKAGPHAAYYAHWDHHAGKHTDPQVLFVINEKTSYRVVGKTVARGPVRLAVRAQTRDTVAARPDPEIACGIAEQDRNRTVHRGPAYL